ncbi:MAG TPA: hypothetical protein VG273_12750 [Bryobacteraceae bacterium]|jgi:hypothetical protein|nr:hypothetical protein [Bryobacteraceae bacterium]
MSFPALLRANAFDGEAAAEGIPAKTWALHPVLPELRTTLAEPVEFNLLDWSHPCVGWGVVAAVPPNATENDLRTSADLPDCIRALIRDRNDAPVFRYRPDWDLKFDQLTNYADNVDVDIASSPAGTGPGCLPQYLLILGDARTIPWRLQFQLNANRFAGRLPLSGTDLDNYVARLRCGWANSDTCFRNSLVWATNHGYPDITDLMFHVLAKPVFEAYRQDNNIGPAARFLGAEDATHEALLCNLKRRRPGVIVTASHGMTGPVAEPKQIPIRLGLPVDRNRQVLCIERILADWRPDGAIWYAHACCSAGTSGAKGFAGLVPADSTLGRTFESLYQAGETIAPLPLALLGSDKPARAFIGHVEPTFDITLRNEKSGQWFTDPIVSTLYDQVYLRHPLGYGMRRLLGNLPGVSSAWLNARKHFAGDDQSHLQMLNNALRGLDLQATVLLGDPTVAIPQLPSGGHI